MSVSLRREEERAVVEAKSGLARRDETKEERESAGEGTNRSFPA